MKHNVFLGLGSNMGEREAHLASSLDEISKISNIIAKSSIIETPSWGIEGLPDYLNMVIEIETDHFPLQLMDEILKIEEKIGRKRTKKWDSRVIDIDILFFNDWFFQTPSLNVPHPFIPERLFVLEPMKEINGDWIHPRLLKTVNELYIQLKNK